MQQLIYSWNSYYYFIFAIKPLRAPLENYNFCGAVIRKKVVYVTASFIKSCQFAVAHQNTLSRMEPM